MQKCFLVMKLPKPHIMELLTHDPSIHTVFAHKVVLEDGSYNPCCWARLFADDVYGAMEKQSEFFSDGHR
jgi:hypothetical protein